MPSKMIRRGDPYKTLLNKSIEVARFYGFQKAQDFFLGIEKTNSKHKNLLGINKFGHIKKLEPLSGDRSHCSVMQSYLRSGISNIHNPILLYYFNDNGSTRNKKNRPSVSNFVLEIYGVESSVAEALILRAGLAILQEAGFVHTSVKINSLGDKDSISRFIKDCSIFYRNKINFINHAVCRKLVKEDLWSLFTCVNEKCKEINSDAPKPIGYLTEKSRVHFKEVLEFMETMDVPYQIYERLVVSQNKYAETVFEMHANNVTNMDTAENIRVAVGGRYNLLSKKLGSRKEIPAVGLSISLNKPIPTKLRRDKNKEKPKVFFIHVGFEAQRKSLLVTELLRKTNIPMLQSLNKDKLTGQIMFAEEFAIPCTIIMGHKEAVENTVIVRNTDTRAQETVPINELSAYLKQLSY